MNGNAEPPAAGAHPLEKGAAFALGAVFLGVVAHAALRDEPLDEKQFFLIRVVASIAVAGVAALVPGFLDLKMSVRKGLGIRAGGAIAAFAIVYQLNPPALGTGHCDQKYGVCRTDDDQRVIDLKHKFTGVRAMFESLGRNPERTPSVAIEARAIADKLASIQQGQLTIYRRVLKWEYAAWAYLVAARATPLDDRGPLVEGALAVLEKAHQVVAEVHQSSKAARPERGGELTEALEKLSWGHDRDRLHLFSALANHLCHESVSSERCPLERTEHHLEQISPGWEYDPCTMQGLEGYCVDAKFVRTVSGSP